MPIYYSEQSSFLADFPQWSTVHLWEVSLPWLTGLRRRWDEERFSVPTFNQFFVIITSVIHALLSLHLWCQHFRLKFDFPVGESSSFFPSLSVSKLIGSYKYSRPPLCHLKHQLAHFPGWSQHHLLFDSWIMNRRWGNEELWTHWERSSASSMGCTPKSQRHNIILQKSQL